MNVITRDLLAKAGFILIGSIGLGIFIYRRSDGLQINVKRNQHLTIQKLVTLVAESVKSKYEKIEHYKG